MTRGSTPALAAERILTIGFLLFLVPQEREPTRSAAAPSLTPEALPAVTTPPSKSGFSFARDSIVESRRGCSSAETTFGGASFFAAGREMAWSSPLKKDAPPNV